MTRNNDPSESRAEELRTLARRALAHYQNGTTDQAPQVLSEPIAAYTDGNRYAQEVERIFRQLPIALGLGLEIPEAGSYLAMDAAGVPLLLVRGSDGVARAFLNVCRHRGSPVCKPGNGKRRTFSCPYHAWTYADDGRLLSVYAEDLFGAVNKDQLGLVELPCEERAGLLWGALTPGLAFDIDAWLGDFAPELQTLDLANWHLHTQRDLPGPGWKVTMDGYLEVYHHNSVHGQTVGQHTIGNLLVLDQYGPHQRMTFGRRSIGTLAEQPEVAWQPLDHIRLIHSGFPNLSVSGILGGHCLVSQIFPGPSPDTTVTRQSVLAATKPESAAEIAATEAFSAMVLQAVQDEDYVIGDGIQRVIHAGANTEFLIGRNEPAVQHYHRNIEHFMAGKGKQ
ncbi:MAG: aromatic ring-hydroxylating dioxygenase subunit alpha [Pseudomonadales bacterium]